MGVLDFYQLDIGKIVLLPRESDPPFRVSVVGIYGIAIGALEGVVLSGRREQELLFRRGIQKAQAFLSFLDPQIPKSFRFLSGEAFAFEDFLSGFIGKTQDHKSKCSLKREQVK